MGIYYGYILRIYNFMVCIVYIKYILNTVQPTSVNHTLYNECTLYTYGYMGKFSLSVPAMFLKLKVIRDGVMRLKYPTCTNFYYNTRGYTPSFIPPEGRAIVKPKNYTNLLFPYHHTISIKLPVIPCTFTQIFFYQQWS